MKKSRHHSNSLVLTDKETNHNDNTLWSEYLEYFPRIGTGPSYSVGGAGIMVFLVALTAVLYTGVYLVFVVFRMLFRSLRG